MKRLTSDNSPALWDEFAFLGKKRRRLLEAGWPGVFRRFVLERLPAEELASGFTEGTGRPTKEVRVMAGALILQQMLDLTDEETVSRLSFDIRWHYALDINGEGDDLKYLCEKTLRNYRSIAVAKGLDQAMFGSGTERLLKAFKVPTEKQRLDSTHLCSNMRNLRRVELLEAVIGKFLRNLKRSREDLFEKALSKEMRDRYGKTERGVFGGGRPSEGKEKLQRRAEDLFWLVERFRGTEVAGLYSYKQMERVLSEQCEVVGEAGEEKRVAVRPAKAVPSDCLQNPCDEDAAYDAHKGVGYQAQVMETYQESKEKPQGDGSGEPQRPPNLITYVRVEPANRSDAHALLPAIEETKERGCAPQELTADGAYGSDENVEDAKGEGVQVIAPAPATGGNEGRITRDKFRLTDQECTCPEGQRSQAVKVEDNGNLVAEFDRGPCLACPLRDRCQVTLTGKRAYLKFEAKQARLARRRTENTTDEFREKYRWRAGIEATFSDAKRTMGAGRLRVRGLPRVRFSFLLKALGLNIQRCGRALQRLSGAEKGLLDDSTHLGIAFHFAGTLLLAIRRRIDRIQQVLRNRAEETRQHPPLPA